MKILYLYRNQIGDIGIDHLINALPKEIALKTLTLNDNKISDNKKEKLKEEWKKAGKKIGYPGL